MSFNNSVVIITGIILIFSLAVFGFVLYYGSNAAKFPPYSYKCPDYWTWDSKTNRCTTDGTNLGYASSYNYVPSNDICVNRKWAKDNVVQWDGVINTNKCV